MNCLQCKKKLRELVLVYLDMPINEAITKQNIRKKSFKVLGRDNKRNIYCEYCGWSNDLSDKSEKR